ncbi:hypothetical protein BDR07DRAFT_1490785 [Suillus spraguei]|nr:hypothetical protein BDR07DRAFT_1490785 [Suillus spraguei]
MAGAFFMPVATSDAAPHFGSNTSELLTFFATVDQLSDKAGITETARIKFVVRYTDSDDADLWRDLPEYDGDNFEVFANAVLLFSPECCSGTFTCASTGEAAAPLAEPYEGDAIERPDAPQLAVKHISPAVSTDIVSAPIALPFDEIAPLAVDNGLKSLMVSDGTVRSHTVADIEHYRRSSDQSLFAEIPCYGDTTAFFTICSICSSADCLCAVLDARQQADDPHSSLTCLDYCSDKLDTPAADTDVFCADIPPIPQFSPILDLALEECNITADYFTAADSPSTQEDSADKPAALLLHGYSTTDLPNYCILAPDAVLASLPVPCSLPLARTLPSVAAAIVQSLATPIKPPLKPLIDIPATDIDFTLHYRIFSLTAVTEPIVGWQFCMPLHCTAAAPYFDGNPRELLMFLATVDELADLAGIADKAHIKAAICYADPDKAEVWECLDEYNGNSFVDFANAILHLYC